ncbi:MAG: nitroreductase family protein [Candidatus Hydrothermarchaeales archaeon]
MGGIDLELRVAIFKRHSIRAFRDDEVEEGRLLKILEDANQAPSAGNLQARDFIVVKDKETKKDIARAALDQGFIAQAPVVIVICANMARSAAKYGRRGAELYSILDAALAAQNLMLSCVEEGLGSCYVGAFYEDQIRKILGVPETVVPIGIIPIGYPDEEPYITDRLPIERIVHREKW